MEEKDYFRESFKYFKQRNVPEVLRDVIDLESIHDPNSVVAHTLCTENSANCLTCIELGLHHHQTWNVYSLHNLKGFYYIKNPFSVAGQQIWIQKCLELYPRKPFLTNLDLHAKQLNDVDPIQFNGIDKLSWVTLGYHYNWETKEYNPAHHSSFPKCLESLSKHIASCLGFEAFRPEAAIINYYNNKSSLGIHDDHSEEALKEPIISFSFGQTAIFLIGTTAKKDKPIPIFLRSGDIIVLSGVSRLSYHAVPAIVPETVDCRYSESKEIGFEKSCYQYITKHRINMSVRQVYLENAA